jgi:hypothetical protein
MEKNTEERQELAETLMAVKSCKRVKNKTTLIEVCTQVRDGHSAKRYKGTLIDSVTANLVCKIWEALSLPEHSDKLQKMNEIAEKNHIAAINICWKLAK